MDTMEQAPARVRPRPGSRSVSGKVLDLQRARLIAELERLVDAWRAPPEITRVLAGQQTLRDRVRAAELEAILAAHR